MASPTISYPSPGGGHAPAGSPAPSQILLHRVASPNHLAQSQYIDSPRSVPSSDHVFQYSTPSEHNFEYDNSQELYVNNEQMYDYNSNGGIHVEQQFVPQELSSNGETTNLMFMVYPLQLYLTVAFRANSTPYSNALSLRKPIPCPWTKLDDTVL